MKFYLALVLLFLAFGASESTTIPYNMGCMPPTPSIQCSPVCAPNRPYQPVQNIQTVRPGAHGYTNIPVNTFNAGYSGLQTQLYQNFGAGGYAASQMPQYSSFAATSAQSYIPSNQLLLNNINTFRGGLVGFADQQRVALQSAQQAGTASNSAIILGSGNVAAGQGNLIGGNQNSVYGMDLSVLGNGNAVKGANSIILGNENSLLKGK